MKLKSDKIKEKNEKLLHNIVESTVFWMKKSVKKWRIALLDYIFLQTVPNSTLRSNESISHQSSLQVMMHYLSDGGSDGCWWETGMWMS